MPPAILLPFARYHNFYTQGWYLGKGPLHCDESLTLTLTLTQTLGPRHCDECCMNDRKQQCATYGPMGSLMCSARERHGSRTECQNRYGRSYNTPTKFFGLPPGPVHAGFFRQPSPNPNLNLDPNPNPNPGPLHEGFFRQPAYEPLKTVEKDWRGTYWGDLNSKLILTLL